MEKVDVIKKATMTSVAISVVSVMISMATAAGQLVTKKGEASISSEVGIAIAAGVIYIFHQIRNWIKKRKEEKRLDSKLQKSGIEFTHYIDMRVKHAENSMFKDYNYMRSFIIHFHNGEFTDAGLSLIKMTVKHEVVGNRSVKKLTDNYQGKPIPEMFYSIIRRIVFEGHYYIEDRELITNNLPLMQWMEIYDAGSMLCIEIKDSVSRKIVAILVMQWKIKGGVHKEQIPQIKEDKKSIEDIYDTL